MTGSNINWFVFYTKSRQEKKVRDLLIRNDMEVFLPLQKVTRQWSDRKKKVEVPLFSSYIFVKTEENAIPGVLSVPGIAWNIRSNGKPAVLHERELEIIKRFIETGYVLETSNPDPELFRAGDKARIIDGPLTGIEGIIAGGADPNKLSVIIEGIAQVIKVQVPAFLLERI